MYKTARKAKKTTDYGTHNCTHNYRYSNLDLPDRAIREQTSSALHLLIQLARFTDGVRRVTHITEVSGMEGQIITLQDLFRFQQTAVDEDGKILGQMAPTGIRPTFAERFEAAGGTLPGGLFMAPTGR